jgi:fatty-acyl-CoA synthase
MNAAVITLDLGPIAGKAHVAGDKSSALWSRTIPELLKDTVSRFPSLEAAVFVEQNVRWSWSEFDREIDALAAGLLKLKLKKGDRVGIWSPNRSEWLLTQFATARIGLILVTINPAYRLSEIEYALNKVDCAALVTAATFKSSDYVEMLQTLAPELETCAPGDLHTEKLPSLRSVIRMGSELTPGMLNFDAIVDSGRAEPVETLDAISATLQPDDAINIQFTSGTTGAPKGATLTHVNVVNNGRFVVEAQNLTETDRLCIPVPLYHCFGMVMGTLGCAATGSTMVFAAEAFDPDSTLRALASEKCTSIYGVPPCSSPCFNIRMLAVWICRRCAPGSWRARRAQPK